LTPSTENVNPVWVNIFKKFAHDGLDLRLELWQLRAMNIKDDLNNYFERTRTGPKDLAALIGLKRWQYIHRVASGERKGFGPELLAKVGAIIYQRKPYGARKQRAGT